MSPPPLLILIQGPTKSLFQGWAIVDNTQNEDWNKVRSSLLILLSSRSSLPIWGISAIYLLLSRSTSLLSLGRATPSSMIYTSHAMSNDLRFALVLFALVLSAHFITASDSIHVKSIF